MIFRSGFLALALLVYAGVGVADDATNEDTSTVDDGIGDLPPSGLTEWFFDTEGPLPSRVEAVPGEPWTSPANIAILDYWLSLVADLGEDPALLQELYGLGMISTPDAAGLAAMQAEVASLMDEDASQQEPSDIPEPASLGLLAGGLVFPALYAAVQIWRMRRGLASHRLNLRGIPCKNGPP